MIRTWWSGYFQTRSYRTIGNNSSSIGLGNGSDLKELTKKFFDLAITAPPNPNNKAVGAVSVNSKSTVPTE